MKTECFLHQSVADVFGGYPDTLKPKMMHLRQVIFDTAAGTQGVGRLEETLKWGQPSYLTPDTKSGTTVRIDQVKSAEGRYGLFVHCQTSLISTFRELYGDRLEFDGKRCVIFKTDEDPPEEALRHCIALALTYHLNKRGDQLPF